MADEDELVDFGTSFLFDEERANSEVQALLRTNPVLNTVPAEILIDVLQLSPDLSTLKAAVHTCSGFHRAYLVAREEILTAVTMLEIASRNIRTEKQGQRHHKPRKTWKENILYYPAIRFKNPPHYVEYNGTQDVEMPDLKAAVQNIFWNKNMEQPLKLTVNQCVALLSLEVFKQYWYDEQLNLYPQQEWECRLFYFYMED